jgi:hypothetical protein
MVRGWVLLGTSINDTMPGIGVIGSIFKPRGVFERTIGYPGRGGPASCHNHALTSTGTSLRAFCLRHRSPNSTILFVSFVLETILETVLETKSSSRFHPTAKQT